MTRNYYTTGSYNVNHSTCGSVIYNDDFDGYVSMTSMAERIISDWKLDEQCRKNVENSNRNKNYKKGTN